MEQDFYRHDALSYLQINSINALKKISTAQKMFAKMQYSKATGQPSKMLLTKNCII